MMLYAIACVAMVAAIFAAVAAAIGCGAELLGREDRVVFLMAGTLYLLAAHFIYRGHYALDRHCERW